MASCGAAAAVALVFTSVARADYEALLKDCSDDERLTQTYSITEYNAALKHIGTDLEEYSDCRNVISRARLLAIAPAHATPSAREHASGSPRAATSEGPVVPTRAEHGQTRSPTDPLPGSSQKSPEQILESATPAQRADLRRLRATPPSNRDVARIVSEQQLGFDGDPGAVNRLPAPLMLVLALLALTLAVVLAGLIRRVP